ncbi:MAG: hypothetical protein BroJett030_31580 [Alphaproteobacteria bacterium]|nr:MAG: hypothetical protein BroJett030_31580 [Alphaproteobacteria bacterium]
MWKRLAIALLAAAMAPASASANYWPHHFQALFHTFPDCADANVSARIIERFNWADRNTWYRGIAITAIAGQYERTVEAFGPYPIFRRYCRGEARLSDGRHETVYYMIERGMGLAGTGYKVEYCLPGHDPWRVYDGHCRVLRR